MDAQSFAHQQLDSKIVLASGHCGGCLDTKSSVLSFPFVCISRICICITHEHVTFQAHQTQQHIFISEHLGSERRLLPAPSMATNTEAIDMATREKSSEPITTEPKAAEPIVSTKASAVASLATDTTQQTKDEDFVPRPMYHQPTHHSIDIEDYFRGPRDITRHSKWPQFARMHGSILPKMIVPLTFIGAWATAITCVHQLVYDIGIQSTLLTVLGFVVGLALSFRSTTAYERFSEGRRYWAQLLLNSRHLARLIWIHTHE